MRELTDAEIKELKLIWDLISTGRADNLDDKARAIKFWNNISGTKFRKNTSCGACLGAVFSGMLKLYKKHYELT
tara:strand:- start:485 stop:706 length:222 start_codon:yes stop_codon:yes gene_type:complete